MEFLSSEEVTQDFAGALERVSKSAEAIEIRQSDDEDSVYLISSQDYQLFQQLLKQEQENTSAEDSDSCNSDITQPNLDFDSFFADLEV